MVTNLSQYKSSCLFFSVVILETDDSDIIGFLHVCVGISILDIIIVTV